VAYNLEVHHRGWTGFRRHRALLQRDGALLRKDKAFLQRNRALLQRDRALLRKDGSFHPQNSVLSPPPHPVSGIGIWLGRAPSVCWSGIAIPPSGRRGKRKGKKRKEGGKKGKKRGRGVRGDIYPLYIYIKAPFIHYRASASDLSLEGHHLRADRRMYI